ncbi:hypothetical protein AaE_013845 [Aphanomyces astaci]|uniref:HTH CENPB-type domain-containing protein n=1 Tax=Aphanomyces astaci TaxID=112090 RepID=A0A6A4ZHG2_APHAT|nr:hypothetical protein AaE_013845 [Aphanomyces astaci]
MANIDNAAANIRRNIKAPQQPEIDSQLAAWVVNANDKGASITGQVIKRKGQLLARELNVDGSIRFSSGWLHRFQQHVQDVSNARRSCVCQQLCSSGRSDGAVTGDGTVRATRHLQHGSSTIAKKNTPGSKKNTGHIIRRLSAEC